MFHSRSELLINSVQGFNQVTAVSMLISAQALLEIAGTLAVFLGGLGPSQVYLHNMGWVTLLSALIAACVGTNAPVPALVGNLWCVMASLPCKTFLKSEWAVLLGMCVLQA